MFRNRRAINLVEHRVQLAMIWRVLIHWSLFAVVMFVVLFCWQFVTGEPTRDLQSNLEGMWRRYRPAFLVLLALLPVVVYDTIKLSSRLAGPLFRLRHATRNLIEGERVSPIRFREGDFCQDLAQNFNILLDRWQGGSESNQSRASVVSQVKE